MPVKKATIKTPGAGETAQVTWCFPCFGKQVSCVDPSQNQGGWLPGSGTHEQMHILQLLSISRVLQLDPKAKTCLPFQTGFRHWHICLPKCIL